MWKYVTIRIKGKVYMDHEAAMLDKLGHDGWELVTIQAYGNIRDYYFKRWLATEEKESNRAG